MKYPYLVFIFLLSFNPIISLSQEKELKNTELENFLLVTDQDLYLSGDRVWFAAKLLKNHESFRYSKLAYISILDPAGNQVHQEKMLLTGQGMIYGDFFIPETSNSGVYSIVVYSKWMANFEDFPVAKKEFLVSNPNSPKPAGDPVLFWEQISIENAPISLFHTSSQSEVIEIQDKNGKTLEILEAVPPMQKTLSTLKPTEGYLLVFRNSIFKIEDENWHWDPADYSLNSDSHSSYFKIFTHTDWKILEEIELKGEKTILNKEIYQDQSSFQISILNGADQLTWSFQVQQSSKSSGQLQISSKGKTGVDMSLDLVGFSSPVTNGIVLASQEEVPQILDFVEILNHPNWKNLTANSSDPNLIFSLNSEVENPPLVKDYSPMYDYKPWATVIKNRFKNSVQHAGFSYFISDEILDPLINRRVYKDHFEISEEVIELQSPFTADKVFYMEDYDEFRDLEGLLKEIVPQVRVKNSKSETGKEILIANTDNSNVKFNKKPLILIDFYKPVSMEDVWKLDLVSLDRIELYYNRSTVESTNLGESVGDGFIVFYTKNNEYFLKNNLPKERFFLSDVSVPRRPDYSGRNSQIITANPLQYLDSGLTFYRGKSKSGNLKFDTAGNWIVEAWVFSNSSFERIQKKIQIDL